MKPHRGTLILVLGILGIVSCFPLGIAAWVMGKRDLKEMDAGTMDPSGRGNTNAGRICGMIGTLMAGIVIVLAIAGMILSLVVFWRDQQIEPQTFERFDAPEPTTAAVAKLPTTFAEVTRERPWTNSLGMPFVPVPGTKVLFCIWETRVQDYAAYASANGRVDERRQNWQNPGFEQGKDHPVVKVGWEDAQAFCQWLTKKEQQEGRTGRNDRYRLPTDAEWSWAVGIGDREGNGTPEDKDAKGDSVYPWGNQWPPPSGAGNYATNYRVDDFDRTAPVGSFKANPYGIHDLGGNVWEWCEDWYDTEQERRVLRGASWFDVGPVALHSSRRHSRPLGFRSDSIGFRVVLAPTQ
jgi:hypothetical protein